MKNILLGFVLALLTIGQTNFAFDKYKIEITIVAKLPIAQPKEF
ncbi:MAG: hypothetical protein JWP81_1577 [Ferruginibacter sp.]|nr:hypothetical protein [Ferruginibacter sp.]